MEMLPGDKKSKSKIGGRIDTAGLIELITDLQQQSEQRQTQMDDMKKDIQEMRRAMYGSNGNMGLVAKLANVEEVTNTVKKLAFVIISLMVTYGFGELVYLIVTHAH